jgi:6-phosphogluconolactonase (cycloisomerase 2 family)
LVEQNSRLTVPTEAVKPAQAGAAAFSFANGRIVQEEAHMNGERLIGKTALATIVALFLAVLAGCGTSTYTTSSSNSTGGGSPPVTYTEFLYVGDTVGVIHAFGVDSSSGVLTQVGSYSVTNMAAASDVRLAADASGTAVYATSAGTGGPNVVALTVNAASGALTAVAANQTLPVPAGKIAVDPKGKNAYVIPDPSANTAEVFGFSIDPTTHGLTALANQPIALPGIPNDVTVDPSGGFVYITFQGTPGHEIAGFSRDPNTGLLTTLGPPFANTGGDSPQGIRVTPNGDFVVAANLATSNVSVLSLAISSGVLNNVAGSPFATGNSPIPVAIDPSGNVVLVGNTGGDSLSAYTIGGGGVLNPVAGTPVPLGSISQPASVAVDPSDKFVYVSNVPHEISGFTLNPSTGTLTPITGSPFSYGAGAPRDVIVVKP